MKKFLYSAVVAAMFAACNPLADLEKEFEEQPGAPVTETYTVDEADYSSLKVSYFSDTFTIDKITPVLNSKFFMLPTGSVMDVNYNYAKINDVDFSGVEFSDYVIGTIEIEYDLQYTLTEADYDSVGQGEYDNFAYYHTQEEIDGFINTILKANFTAANGDIYEVTYDYYDNGTNAVSATYEFDGTDWNLIQGGDIYLEEEKRLAYAFQNDFAYELLAIDYDAFPGSAQYNNFSSSAKPEDHIPVLLKARLGIALADAKIVVKYKYYNGSGTEEMMAEYVFDGEEWAATPEVELIEMTDKFEKKENTWEAIVAIEYTLTTADYDFLGEEYGQPGYYDNFDIRTGQGEEERSDLITRVTTVLEERFTIEEGTVYIVTYAYYDGSNGTGQIKLIKENGEWKEYGV